MDTPTPQPIPTSEPAPQADAALFTTAWASQGGKSSARLNRDFDRLAPLLGTDKPVIREVGGGRFLATADPNATLLFPHGHPRALEPRYTWRQGPEGLMLGTLKPE